MKFAVFALLATCTTALRLTHHQPRHQLVKVPTTIFKKFIKTRQDDGPDSEEEDEIEAWATKELTTGDKTITKKEAHDFFAGFAKKHGYKMTKEDWEGLNQMFDAADTNHDGEIDLDELMAACGDDGPEDIKLPKKFVKKFLKIKQDDEPDLDSEDEHEIEDWATHELTTGDKTITKKEAYDFFSAFAKKKGWKVSKEEWDQLEAMFDEADLNHDGELDLDEVMAACGGPDDIKIPKKMIKKYKKMMLKNKKRFLKSKQDDEPNADDAEGDEIEAWAKSELANDGTITGEEAVKFFGAYAKKHDYPMKPMDWATLGYFFGQADTNHDGELDAAEVEAAMAQDH